MKSTLHHPLLGEVSICSSSRSVRISLAVQPTGEIRLSHPPYISQRRALEFLESKREWVQKVRARYATRPAQPKLSAHEVESLRSQAKEYLPARVAEIASQFGFRYGRVTIRAARSKWGCCTSQGNLSLSLFLMLLPRHLQDYVIVHELCHTVHHNHSPKFHALVDRCLQGKEKEFIKELRGYHIPR